jgi:RNA methyltransferase, TrmH family
MHLCEHRSSLIASRNHPAVRRFRALHLREERDRAGLFVAEGVRFLSQAVEERARIESLLIAPTLLTHAIGRRRVRQLRGAGVPCLEVTPEVLQSVALSDDPQGVCVVVRQGWRRLRTTHPADGLCWIVLSRIHSPGNLGSLVRTADAVGAGGILFLGDGPDPYDPATVRASMGAIFSQRFIRATTAELAEWRRQHGAFLVGTSPSAAHEYRAVEYRPPTLLFVGDERKGLTTEEQALCDTVVRIPMVGRADSLNLSVATAVVLYEVFHQRRGRV